ncbi:hypothetical protein GE061_010440 [Apolygus lucorum]|uniref:Retrovirus-related Pol polyprotein from transposon TNT 1-94-like beta-barrel domain-containing protein n=1 Tax=Apolygus lucorum TaxID=248454 RepID=A0A8S9XUL7_APOLU|nr:hypothetical protein GE061_010440 [Apolygus lucorum]
MRRAQSWDMRQNKQPQVLKMKLGYAKMLACRFETSTDAAFKIFGNRNGSDNSDVWVAIGENEKRAPDVAKYLHENKDMALHNSEGNKIFSAIVDSGATEHLANNLDFLSNVKKLTIPRVFKCANDSRDADLVVEYQGDIEFINDGRKSTLKNVLYAPGLGSNLFSVRKVVEQGMTVILKQNLVEFWNVRTNELIKTGLFKDNLWWLDFELKNRNSLKRRHGNLDSPVDKKRTRNMGFSTAECCEGEIVVTAGGSKDPHPLEFVGGRESEREDALVKIQGMDSLENRVSKYDLGVISQKFKPSVREKSSRTLAFEAQSCL